MVLHGVDDVAPRHRLVCRFGRREQGDAVHRREIFDLVWADGIVSDSALTQAIRTIRRTLGELPPNARPLAERLAASEALILGRLEPLLGQRIDALQIRYHGDLHLGRVLFTGKDFVFTGIGGGRDRLLPERRRKRGAMRDVASLVRSFHYAAATSLGDLRSEDQVRAEPWGWAWQRMASAAYLRGYLERAGGAPFVSKSPQMLSVLLEVAMLEKAFGELRHELRRRPDMAWIPLQGIVRMLGLDG